jgi:hypothetical protein
MKIKTEKELSDTAYDFALLTSSILIYSPATMVKNIVLRTKIHNAGRHFIVNKFKYRR